MKIKSLIASIAAILFFSTNIATVHAEEDLEIGLRVYNLSYDTYSSSEKTHFEGTIISYTRVCFLITGERTVLGSNSQNTTVDCMEFVYDPPEGGAVRSNHVFVADASIYTLDGEHKKTTSIENSFGAIALSARPTWESIKDQGYGRLNLKTDIPIFSTYEDVLIYFETGDASSAVNRDKLNEPHDFSRDTLNKDIPVPELMQISHNGFTVTNNYAGQYYIDIIQATVLYGVDIEKTGLMKYRADVDFDWMYSFQMYNYADARYPTNEQIVDIREIYGIDPESQLIEDFKKWTEDYPNYASLPSYAWNKSDVDAAEYYNAYHLYRSNAGATDLEQLENSMQSRSTYIVRYRDDDGDCGAWVKYVYQPIGKLGGAYIRVDIPQYDDSGNIKTDANGNLIIDSSVKGEQDNATGLPTYRGDGSGSASGGKNGFDLFSILSNVDDFFGSIGNIFEGMSSSLGQFSSLVSACFSFLPAELMQMIIWGIGILVFIGIIKAVKK